MKLSEISIYPIKSLAGIKLHSSEVISTGLYNDRNMMLVNPQGIFVSQRKYPRMALVKTHYVDKQLILTAPGMPELPIPPFANEEIEVEVWKKKCHGFVANETSNQWFSEFLKTPLKLVNYNRQKPRATDPNYSRLTDTVSFADGFPLLVISQASLDELNSRLKSPVTMQHFRPNIVVTGSDAFAEDDWKSIRIGEVEFEAVKTCSRCVLTTVDPQTGVKDPDREPLKTLSQFRKMEAGIMFGMNLIPRGEGSVKLNDRVVRLS